MSQPNVIYVKTLTGAIFSVDVTDEMTVGDLVKSLRSSPEFKFDQLSFTNDENEPQIIVAKDYGQTLESLLWDQDNEEWRNVFASSLDMSSILEKMTPTEVRRYYFENVASLSEENFTIVVQKVLELSDQSPFLSKATFNTVRLGDAIDVIQQGRLDLRANRGPQRVRIEDLSTYLTPLCYPQSNLAKFEIFMRDWQIFCQDNDGLFGDKSVNYVVMFTLYLFIMQDKLQECELLMERMGKLPPIPSGYGYLVYKAYLDLQRKRRFLNIYDVERRKKIERDLWDLLKEMNYEEFGLDPDYPNREYENFDTERKEKEKTKHMAQKETEIKRQDEQRKKHEAEMDKLRKENEELQRQLQKTQKDKSIQQITFKPKSSKPSASSKPSDIDEESSESIEQSEEDEDSSVPSGSSDPSKTYEDSSESSDPRKPSTVDVVKKEHSSIKIIVFWILLMCAIFGATVGLVYFVSQPKIEWGLVALFAVLLVACLVGIFFWMRLIKENKGWTIIVTLVFSGVVSYLGYLLALSL